MLKLHGRVMALVVMLVAAAVWHAGPASAAAPDNDTQVGAVAMTPLPFSYTQDTTEATVDDSEVRPATTACT
jgi:hypothetical protein